MTVMKDGVRYLSDEENSDFYRRFNSILYSRQGRKRQRKQLNVLMKSYGLDLVSRIETIQEFKTYWRNEAIDRALELASGDA